LTEDHLLLPINYFFTMDIKPRPNHARYIDILRAMPAEKKVEKVFELNDMARELCLQGLRQRHPGITEQELTSLYLKTIEQYHNRNY
jgi:hypothetical protein